MRTATLAALAATAWLCQAQPKERSAIERLHSDRLQAVHDQRMRWDRERVNIPLDGIYHDYRAVIHVHAEDAKHTLGTRQQVLEAARQDGVNVVLWTDHDGPKPDTWRGIREKVLFIPGSEDDNHQLRFPSPSGEVKFWSHLEELPDPVPDGYAGTEIYNRHTDAEAHKELNTYFQEAMEKPRQWRGLEDKQKRFPDEVFGAGTGALPGFLAKWDAVTVNQQFTGIGANDAHRNQVFKGVVFDPYEVAFRNLSTHILARNLTEDEVLESLRGGHVYVSHDWLCDPSGFMLVAVNNLGVFDMGDRVPMQGQTDIQGRLPVPAKIRILRDGQLVHSAEGDKIDFTPKEAGTYRLEAWLTVDGEERPWIYANPFYFYKPPADEMALPSSKLDEEVESFRDITYTEGKPESANKHKLDVYAPKNASNAPVLLWVHGGAWMTGDRWMYRPLGNRFAKQGYVVIIPSYRLMPGSPYPAQIEDVAAAFAWARQYVSKYGGNGDRIFLAGHSAGGHLVSLLALDPKWLKPYDLTPKAIRGVMTLSGVYDVSRLHSFGNQEARKDASPIEHIHPDAPPFLITYCRWDYLGLPAQARRFDAELRKSFVGSKLVFIKGQNHISEILHITRDGDPTANAMLGFMASVPAEAGAPK